MSTCFYKKHPNEEEILECFVKSKFNSKVKLNKVYSKNYSKERVKDLLTSKYIKKGNIDINNIQLKTYQSESNIAKSKFYFVVGGDCYYENISDLQSLENFMRLKKYNVTDIATIVFQIIYENVIHFDNFLDQDGIFVKKIPQSCIYIPEIDFNLYTNLLYKTNATEINAGEVIFNIMRLHINNYGLNKINGNEKFWHNSDNILKSNNDQVFVFLLFILERIYKETKESIISEFNSGDNIISQFKLPKNSNMLNNLAVLCSPYLIFSAEEHSYDATLTYGNRWLTILNYYKNHKKSGYYIRLLYGIVLPENINKNNIYDYTCNEISNLKHVLTRDKNIPILNFFKSNEAIENYTIDEILKDIYPIEIKKWTSKEDLVNQLYKLKNLK